MRLFIDASAWIPMYVERDQWRRPLQRVMARLRREGSLEMVTSNWTAYEALSRVRRRQPWLVAALHARIRQARMVQVDDRLEAAAFEQFLRWADRPASVVDHANVLVAREARCEAIVSFDRDYFALAAAAGLRVLR